MNSGNADGRWHTPFTPQQVAALRERQRTGTVLPHQRDGIQRCGIDIPHPPLEVTESGWYCRGRMCAYERTWADPIPVTLRHWLIAAELTGHLVTDAGDGCAAMVMHSEAEAADRAIDAWKAWAKAHPVDAVAMAMRLDEWMDLEPDRCRYTRFDHASPPYGPRCTLLVGHPQKDHEYGSQQS